MNKIKIRTIITFILIPLIGGYLVAFLQQEHKTLNENLNFSINHIAADRITLVEKGTIFSLTHQGVTSIPTNYPSLIEAMPLGNNFLAVDKKTNYSSLDEFSSTGSFVKTIQDGNATTIDTMDWFTDPAVSINQQKIAFVSDKDKDKTNILDNALFVEDLTSSSVQKVADPDPHSGGITHPVWDPANPDIIIYDYYQYDKNDNPYSIIDEYNIQTQTTNPLTTREQNAYQGSFSPDGKQLIFLQRENDITTGMFVADITKNGLINVRSIATGDFAYPTFSNTHNHIYFLQAQANSGYDLYTAVISHNKLSNVSAISTGEQLQANSGFTLNSN